MWRRQGRPRCPSVFWYSVNRLLPILRLVNTLFPPPFHSLPRIQSPGRRSPAPASAEMFIASKPGKDWSSQSSPIPFPLFFLPLPVTYTSDLMIIQQSRPHQVIFSLQLQLHFPPRNRKEKAHPSPPERSVL